MKSFYQFQEDSSSQAQSAISGSGSFRGSSDVRDTVYDRGFKKRPSTGLGKVAGAVASAAGRGAGRAAGAIKDRMGRPRPEKAAKPVDGRYRIKNKAATPKPERAGALAKRPEKTSRVQKKTAAAEQPPQRQQIAARPVTTAMAGSRQKPAIRPGTERKALSPAKSNLSRDNQGVQKVNVKVEPRKALPPGEGEPMSGGARPRIAPKPQKALAPARG